MVSPEIFPSQILFVKVAKKTQKSSKIKVSALILDHPPWCSVWDVVFPDLFKVCWWMWKVLVPSFHFNINVRDLGRRRSRCWMNVGTQGSQPSTCWWRFRHCFTSWKTSIQTRFVQYIFSVKRDGGYVLFALGAWISSCKRDSMVYPRQTM